MVAERINCDGSRKKKNRFETGGHGLCAKTTRSRCIRRESLYTPCATRVQEKKQKSLGIAEFVCCASGGGDLTRIRVVRVVGRTQ